MSAAQLKIRKEPARLTPWWVINSFNDGSAAGLSATLFSDLLSQQLYQWSRRSGVILPKERSKWWDISNLNLPLPQTAVDLHKYLSDFLLLNYPLRRHGAGEPGISGAIDSTKLTIAITGDVRDVMSRTYLHCLGRLLRMEAADLLDPIDIKLLAFIYLPHNAHHHPDRNEIARFLTELHTMMLQSAGDNPFEAVFFLQDKNYSATYKRDGYDQLSSTQLVELMCQTLFHSMIGEGIALREIGRRYSPVYLSMGSVSIYYDWERHKQKLAEKASGSLIRTFASSRQAPYIDELEADIAVSSIKHHLVTQQLTAELVRVTKSMLKEDLRRMVEKEFSEDPTDKGAKRQRKDAEYERVHRLYREAVRLSAQRLSESVDILWKGDSSEVRGTERVIIESIRAIFEGKYGSGNARALEQALLVLKGLEELFAAARCGVSDVELNESLVKELLESLDPDAPTEAERKESDGPNATMPLVTVFQVDELLSLIPFWAKIAAGIAVPVSGLLYWRRRKKRAREQLAQMKEAGIEALAPVHKQSLKRDLQKGINTSLTEIYVQATTLVQNLEVFIADVRNNMEPPHDQVPINAYPSTTFCRSVFEELRIPGRSVYKPLISNGNFAPTLSIGDRHLKFEELEHNAELGILIKKFFTQKPEVKKELTPAILDPFNVKALSVKSAEDVSSQFLDFANELYDESPRLGMDDALQEIKSTGKHTSLVEFASEAAWPPVIFSQSNINKPPVYLEMKYHNLEVLDDVFGDLFSGKSLAVRKETQEVRDGDLLSLGIFQPIPVANTKYSSLNCIHTIAAMKEQMSLDELRDPSLVFTLATLPRAQNEAELPALVNALNGVKLLPPAPLINDIELFRRELSYVSLARRGTASPPQQIIIQTPSEARLLPTREHTDEYNIVAMAQFKDHPSNEPFLLEQEYVLQAGLYSEDVEDLIDQNQLPGHDQKEVEIQILVHAAGMEVEPTALQAVTFRRHRFPQFAQFKLKPIEAGRKAIHIEFLHLNSWLTGVKFEVEVVEANVPVPGP